MHTQVFQVIRPFSPLKLKFIKQNGKRTVVFPPNKTVADLEMRNPQRLNIFHIIYDVRWTQFVEMSPTWLECFPELFQNNPFFLK